MQELQALIAKRQTDNAERELALVGTMKQTYAAARTLLGKSTLGPMVEDQSAQRKLIEDLRTDMDQIKESASTLSSRVKQLDRTLNNLAIAKEYMRSLDEMKNVDGKLASCIKSGQLKEGVEIVQRIHKYKASGFLEVPASVAALETQLCELVRAALAKAFSTDSTRMLFALGKEEEAIERYTESVRLAFSNQCQVHVDRALEPSNASDEVLPKHVEAVTGIFLHLAEVVQRNEEFIDSNFGTNWFVVFLNQIEYTANAHAVRVIRALMKTTNSLKSGETTETQIRNLDFCLEELVSVIVRCKRFLQYLDNLRSDSGNAQIGSLQQVIEEVAGVYVSGEHALIGLLVERAIQDDAVDVDDKDTLWSSVVEDVFFIFKKAMDRSLLTKDPNCACAIVNNITTTLQIEFKEFLEDSFGNSKRLFNYCLNGIISGKKGHHPMLPVFTQRLEELNGGTVSSSRITSGDSLSHTVANVAITCSYLVKFRSECLNSFDEHVPDDPRARSMFQQCLSAFDLLTAEFNGLHTGTMKYILQQLRGSFIAPFISAVDNVNFNVDEAGFADMQVNDPYMRAFIASLEALVSWIKAVCVPESITLFLSLLCDYVNLRFEKFALASTARFSILGAAQLYQDISRLVSFFVQNTQVPVRVKFGRLQELCSILCVESLAEFQQLYPASTLKGLKITSQEAQGLLSLRTDLIT